MLYAKLFSSITESSLWCEPKEVRLLFVSMLAKADEAGFVEAALPGLARLANLTLDEVKMSVEILEGPDPNSKNPDNDGRRLLKVPGGWVLLNYEDYRGRRGVEERRSYMRNYMQDYRKKNGEKPKKEGKKVGKQPVNSVNSGKQVLNPVKESPSYSYSPSLLTRKEDKLPFESEEFVAAWAKWTAHREEIKKPLKPSMVAAQLKKMKSMGESRSIAMIEFTLFKGWQGLVEPDEPTLFDQTRKSGNDPRGNMAAAKQALENLNGDE